MIYDIIIIGGGAAGFSAAQTAVQEGAKVCLVEREMLGGECPYWACVPSKALLRSARAYWEAKHEWRNLGVHATSVAFRFADIMRRKQAVVDTITGKGKKLEAIARDSGITVVKGEASFIDSHTISVAKKRLKGKRFILATGSNTFIPPVDGLQETGYLTFREVIALKKQPRSIVIIGGGPVGCEFATFFGMLGTRVTLLEWKEQLLFNEDEEIGAMASAQLTTLGVDVLLHAKALSVKREGKKVRVTYQVGSKKRASVLVDRVLVATGKRPAIEGLALEKAGVKIDAKGQLVVDAYGRTTVKHILVAGDVDGGWQLTHVAHAEGALSAHNALARSVKQMKKRDFAVVPRVTFTYPEVASVGMTLKEFRGKKAAVKIASYPVGYLGRAVTDNHRVGLLKIIVEKKSGAILGASMIGERAGEVIHELALAMHVGATAHDVATLLHAFPTYSEAIAGALARFE